MSDEQDAKDKSEKKKKPSAKAVEKASVLGGAKNGRVVFKDIYEIFPHKPLPQYDIGPNKAYAATQKKGAGGAVIAILCERNVVPRLQVVNKYLKFSNPNMCLLLDSGVVYWPSASQERYAFFYQDNLGDPLLRIDSPDKPLAAGWKPEIVMDKLVRPMVSVFHEMHDRDFVHGAVRPNNIFGVRSGNLNDAILGDCLSAPASSMQPSLFEPIERAMADPFARGRGSKSDDLYSFGVTLAVMMRVNDPLKGLNDEEVLRKKIEFGTYAAITGKDRFKGDILELLRGVLHDDPLQRWTIEDAISWLDGRRLSPKQSLVRKRAPRPMHFGGAKFFYAPSLAMAFTQNSAELKRVIEDDTLKQWLQRAIDDEEAIERVEKAIAGASEGGSGPDQQERLVSHVSSALDQFAPLRYRGLAVLGDGVGMALADAMARRQDVTPFVGILSSNVMPAWLGFHENNRIDITGLYTKFEHCKRLIRSQKMGEGLERCLYLLSEETACLSPLLDDYFVANPARLLLAFEDLCQAGKIKDMFIDRHVAAFLMQRDSAVIETRAFDLNSGDKSRITLANLRCLADIQKRYNMKPVPAISKYFSGLMNEACEQYHDRRLRKTLKDGVMDLADSGDLSKMVVLLDDPRLLRGDKTAYDRARLEYYHLTKEAADLAQQLEGREGFGMETGRQWAAVGSGVLASIVIFAMTVMILMKDPLF